MFRIVKFLEKLKFLSDDEETLDFNNEILSWGISLEKSIEREAD